MGRLLVKAKVWEDAAVGTGQPIVRRKLDRNDVLGLHRLMDIPQQAEF